MTMTTLPHPPARPLPTNLAQKLPPLIPRRRKVSAQEGPLEPAPETPDLPTPTEVESAQFKVPSRRILSPEDLEKFRKSNAYSLILAFVFGVSDAVREVTISAVAAKEEAGIVKEILGILDDAQKLLEKNPPLDTGSRFGNPIFRTFLGDIVSQQDEWHKRLQVPNEAVKEVSVYLENAFGSASRIDYGSGHELNFFLWLLCLNRLSLLPQSAFQSLALAVYPRYLKLMRNIQMTYYLEPAGSHGVWGLDDYQFMPFLLGASQLVHHPYITPKSIHNQATLEEGNKEYLYLNQVAFVNSVKNVDGLRWHSPMLDDISSAKSWEKIEAGMKKMFIKEVLGKLPVMQHFLFGSLIPAAEGMSEDAEAHDVDCEHDHDHGGKTWDDCCGIKVPSSLGAAGEMKKRMGDQGLRRLPFD